MGNQMPQGQVQNFMLMNAIWYALKAGRQSILSKSIAILFAFFNALIFFKTIILNNNMKPVTYGRIILKQTKTAIKAVVNMNVFRNFSN